MRKLVVLLMSLMLSPLAQAEAIVPFDYNGKVEGTIGLATSDGTYRTLSEGDVKVEINRVNFFGSPLEFMKSARRVFLIQGDNEFIFQIPSEYGDKEGRVTVGVGDAKQLANISIIEEKPLIESKEVVDDRHYCQYQGGCTACYVGANGQQTCGEEMCSGHQQALVRRDTYGYSLQILIFNDKAVSKIQTDYLPDTRTTLLKALTKCR